MSVLVTGGAGYIGSHTVKKLKQQGYSLVVYDNFSKGHQKAIQGIPLVEGDLRDLKLLEETMRVFEVTDVIHFASLSCVGESMAHPAKYYENNVMGSVTLLNAMLTQQVQRIVFSSSAAVYGDANVLSLTEDCVCNPVNVYGKTKLMVEQILADYKRAYGLKYISLRYFNACGADDCGMIGEDHSPETHLIPLVLKTALGQREKMSIYGNDYNTKDGTCIRDYIHVNDLAHAHLLALEHLRRGGPSDVLNLGNGNGFSVKEVIDCAAEVTKRAIPTETTARRQGDPAILVASSDKARRILGWKPDYTDLKKMISTAWHWHLENPEGFKGGGPYG